MKKTLTAFAVAAIFAACNGKQSNTDTAITPAATNAATDTSAPDKSEVINMNGVSDTIVTANGQYVKVQPNAAAPAETKEVKTTKPAKHKTRRSSASSGNETVSNGSSSAGTESAGTQPAVQKKKGWSSAAKGAVIGAGTGAVAGAIISKKKGLGAIIGGVAGAGGGYAIGRAKDKKKAKSQQ